MNLKQLEHLLAVADTGSFSRAAERVHLTQSALSRSIQMLEEDLNARMIDRIGHRNELTPLGEAVASRARHLVSEAEDLRSSVALLRAGSLGPIRVGLGSGPGAMLMTPFLIYMAQHHSDVRVAISRGAIEPQLIQLRERVLDALVIDVHSVAPAADLVIEDVAEMRAGFICRSAHPLISKGNLGISFDKLLQYPLGSAPLADEVAHSLIRLFGQCANPDQAMRLRCEEVGSLIEAVRQSDAIFFGGLAAARSGITSGELVEIVTIPPLNLSARYALVTLVGRTESPSMKLFRCFVAEKLRD